MRSRSLLTSRRSFTAIDFGHEFALVDVETTGFNPRADRIVQVAIRQLDRFGNLGSTWSTLVQPGRDPGPTHIHGISAAMLVGAPVYASVAGVVADMVSGRVIVAHSAGFDWGFLQAESIRAACELNSEQRLCTLALARRLDLDLPNYQLGTLATWAHIQQRQAHSAVDDVRVLEAIFRKLMALAIQGHVVLPLSANTSPATMPYGAQAPSVEFEWQLPGPWIDGSPFTQGMKFVVTGGTRTSRSDLYDQAVLVGLIPMNSVSRTTCFVVCNDPSLTTRKARQACSLGIPVVDESRFLLLLPGVRPGLRLLTRGP